jgi:hypothetical protein
MIEHPELIGAKVIVRSNEDEPATVGTLIGWQKIHNQEFPLIKYDNEEEPYLCFALVLPYSEELLKFLDGLGSREGWKIMADVSVFCQVRNRKAYSKP